MHRRSDSLRRRRCAGTPFIVAASLALTVGLLGSATAAHAAVVPSASPTPAASVTVKGAAFSATARGELVLGPGEEPTVGTKVKWSITVTNTGDVPLDDVARTIAGPGRHLEPGQTLELATSTTLNQKQLTESIAVFDEFAGATTPDRVSVYARIRGRLALPTPTPTTPAPTPTTPTPTTPTTPAVASDGVTATVRGALDLEPGQMPEVGTPVKWTITVHNSTPSAVFVLKTLVRLEPGESAEVDDNLPPAKLTQADLDAGVITYRSRFDVGTSGSQRTIRAQGELTLPKTAPTPASDRVTASVRAVPDLEPGEQVKVGTVVKWIVTFHHSTPDTARIDGTTLVLTPGRSGYVEDTTKPSTVTQADLDAGVVTYRSEFSVSTT